MKQPEVWMRGPIMDVPTVLQPVAHALLQAVEEMEEALRNFDDGCLWTRPADMASVGFHLQHMCGVVDRLFTYARAESLTDDQFAHLRAETVSMNVSSQELVQKFKAQVDKAIAQLRITHPEVVFAARGVGRQQIPTNMLGLLFHAAEHTQRHLGQLLVTVKWVSSLRGQR